MAQVVVVLVLSTVLGVALSTDPLDIIGSFAIVMLGAAFFSCLSMTIAGIVLKRDRLMGIGQMITVPLFFASNALYPVSVMPHWLQVLALVNPLSYEVDALRGMLIGTHAHLLLDFGVVSAAVVIGVVTASSLVGRLAR
jgi:ABC-2 type transport system permease protein